MNFFGLAELLLILVAVGGSGIMVAFLAWLVYRLKRLEESRAVGGPELRELIERIETMQTELLSMRDDVGELTERVDFTERLLSSGSRPAAAQPDVDRPPG